MFKDNIIILPKATNFHQKFILSRDAKEECDQKSQIQSQRVQVSIICAQSGWAPGVDQAPAFLLREADSCFSHKLFRQRRRGAARRRLEFICLASDMLHTCI
jgi:hypothetical protein